MIFSKLKTIDFLLAIAMIVAMHLPLLAQNNMYFDHIDSEHGLSQNDVNCIYQDQEGFMWFGTHDGLNKYDGYNFKVYTPDFKGEGSISSNLIYSMTGDVNGNLWIGTTGSGLNFFDKSTGKFIQYKHDKDNFKSLSSNTVSKVIVDMNNRLWVATSNGINMADLNTQNDQIEFQRYYPTAWDNFNKHISGVFEDSNGGIWAGGVSDLFKLSRDSEGALYFKSMNEIIDLPHSNVRSIKEDGLGRLILSTENGIFVQNTTGGSLKVLKVYDGDFSDFTIDGNNNLWVGSDFGLWYFENLKNGETQLKLKQKFVYEAINQNGISKNIIRSVFIDRTGVLWVGTNGGGVNKFDPNRKKFRHFKQTLNPTSLSYDKIRVIYEDSFGSLWIGTEGGGLNMLAKQYDNGEYSNFQSFNKVLKAFAIAEIQEGDQRSLLIGAENKPGLYKIDIAKGKRITEKDFKPIPEIEYSVFSLLADKNGTVWIGTYNGGFHRWEKAIGGGYKKSKFVHDQYDEVSVSDNIIRDIFEDSKGNIWFATGNGLSKLPEKEKYKELPKFENYRNIPGDSTSLSHNYILTIFEDSNGVIWIGTFGGGLNRMDYVVESNSYQFKDFSEKDGLSNNVIKGILEDDNNNLWISTNKGLSKFDPRNSVFKNYDLNDGLQSNEFQELACLKRKNGEMLFGGINGINVFNPGDIEDNNIPPETVLTSFSIFNQPIEIGAEMNGRIIMDKPLNELDELKLKYEENSFSFEFAALHYAAPKKNNFAYMLEGFDKDWIYTSSEKRFATYTFLEPGTYTLKVKASNNDGVWDETPSKINLTIIPPIWRTPIAFLFYGLLVLGFIWLLIRIKLIRTREKHQLELEHLENVKNEEIQQMKLEFFTNISHEFRTPLTLIKGPLDFLLSRGEKLDSSALKSQYSIIKKNTDTLLKLVNQILDFRKLAQGKMKLVVRRGLITSFIEEIGEPFQFLARKKEIIFKISTPDGDIESWYDHDALEKIFNNLLSNAFKFTPEGGEINVIIRREVNGKSKNDGNEDQLENFNFVSLEVQDSGPGIDKSLRKRVFERFYVDKGVKGQNNEGAGIGLAFVKSLVELHQGTIKIDSRPEGGARFVISLPIERSSYENLEGVTIKEDDDPDFLTRTSELESFAIERNDEIEDTNMLKSKSKKQTLLVVDDNEDIRKFIKEVFSESYTIYEAENGRDGFELAKKVMPNLILTDVLMPIMGGIEFCETLKSTNETSHIPVIMLTAKISDESEVLGRKIGADGYVRKPFDIELLGIQIENILKNRQQLRKRFNREINLQPKEITVTSADENFLNHAIEIVENNMMNTEFNVEMLVKEMGYSRSNLYLKFKEITGLSSSEFIRNIRLKRAIQLFETSNLSVKEIMYMTGFNTASYFAKCFKKQFGVVPSEYVKKLDQEKPSK